MLSAAILLAMQSPSALGTNAASTSWRNDSLSDTTRGARRGDKRAQFELGRRYEYGDGVERNLRLALRWYSRAARTSSVQTYVYSGPIGSERHGRAIPVGVPTSAVGIPAAALRAHTIRQTLKGIER